MTIFFSLFARIIPLYVIIVLGSIAGRYLAVPKESIARLLIYIIVPIVVFSSALSVELSAGTLLLPMVVAGIASTICLSTYAITRRIWKGSEVNILSYASGSGNFGYFGLPVAIALFGPEVGALMIVGSLGGNIFKNTLGFYITARGTHTVRESLIKLSRLPTLYAFAIGIALNAAGIHPGPIFNNFALLFKGAFSVLGMMLIGLGLAGIKSYRLDLSFISITLIARFLVWPAMMALFLTADASLLHIFSPDARHILNLISIVPIAANVVAFATELRMHPDKAATAVIISTLFALVYIPLYVSIFAL